MQGASRCSRSVDTQGGSHQAGAGGIIASHRLRTDGGGMPTLRG